MKLTAVTAEMKIGSGAFERSSVAWTTDGRLVVAADMGIKPVLYFGEEPVRGSSFTMRPLVDGTEKNPIYANRIMNSMVVVDADGGVWVTAKCGTKGMAGKKGITRGVLTAAVFDGDDPEVELTLKDVGHGMAQAVPGRAGCVVMGTEARWVQYDGTMGKIGSGDFGQMGSGEKIQFRIATKSGTSVWHVCHSGCSREPSRYLCTGMAKGITWADYKAYPMQGDDTNHPGLGVDKKKPYRAVMGAVYGGQVRVNLADNGVLAFNAATLPSLGEATIEDRHGPQFIPNPKGGMICLFNLKGKVMWAQVQDVLAGSAKAQVLLSGRFASGAVRGDRLAVCYASGGGLVKKEFRVEV